MDKLLLGLVIVALMILGPWVFLWSLNTLFGLSVVFTPKTWLAVMVFIACLNLGPAES